MTWKELKEWIEMLSKEQQETDVTIYLEHQDEFYPLNDVSVNNNMDIDVLDEGHPFLNVLAP